MRYPKHERLKLRLRRLGCTQQELANAIFYSRGYVAAVLNGRRAERCLTAIEHQLHVWEKEEGGCGDD